MGLKIHIHKIKCIEDLEFDMPIEKGLYALTGMNGSGKSTIAASAASVFYNVKMNEYFGPTDNDSYISFELNGAQTKWHKFTLTRRLRKVWGWGKSKNGHINLKGFYEGSLIYGNRFRDTSFNKVLRLEKVNNRQLLNADDFIRTNLGLILQGNADYYERLFYLEDPSFNGKIFFYEKNSRRVSQFHMSTGENLLISILNSLLIRINERSERDTPCLVILDEIELALHPASLKRLVYFLEDMSSRYNYAIYFSTHSLELISGIVPDNIFFIERHSDNTIEIINPCYPAYATRTLYDHSGYDYVIMVEDDLAKSIVDNILRREMLLNGKLVHVLPCGGYTKVIDLANDVVEHNLLGRISSVCVVLDGDVKEKASSYINKRGIKNNIPLNYLPIESLEKFLRNTLYVSVDQTFFRRLNDYLFHQTSLTEILEEYEKNLGDKNDSNGKILYGMLEKELKARRIDRSELIDFTVKYLVETEKEKVKKIAEFLRKQLE